jgi:beta-galactosidase
VFLPGLFSPSADFVAALQESGAIIQMGPRSGAKTPDFHIPDTLPPGPLQRLINIKVRRVASLRPGVSAAIAQTNGANAFVKWREYLTLENHVETALQTADDEPALVSHDRAYYLAGQPNAALADHVVRRLLKAAHLPFFDLPQDIRIRHNGDLRYIFNYGPQTVDITQLAESAPLLLGALMLEPCGVAALRPDSFNVFKFAGQPRPAAPNS